jgi:DNA polymerase-3 subunit chi
MTEIAFHFNASDKLEYACRLLRKAFANSARVVVAGGEQQLHALDTALWTFSAQAFVPHCMHDASQDQLVHTPVVFVAGSELPHNIAHHHVLLNLGQSLVKGFESFERIIEIVSLDSEDKIQARLRWKHYADRGYSLQRHDLASVAS